MKSIKLTFTRAATGKTDDVTIEWLFWALAIDDDRQHRQKERRKKRERAAIARCKPKPSVKPPGF